MKKAVFILICLMAVSFYHCEAYGLSDNTNKEMCKNAICSRIQLLSDFYTGSKPVSFVTENLKELESEEMLDRDLELIKQYSNTDIDVIKKFAVKSNRIKRQRNNVFIGSVKIRYKMENCIRTYFITVKYNYKCILIKKNSVKKIKILRFTV